MTTLAAQAPRTLIADDQPDVLMALRLLLKGAGYQTEAVASPAAVIEAIKQRNFDLVLMDLNYARDTTSGREGLDLLSRIKAVDNTLPVVVMTAWGSVDLAVEAMRQGVRDFVQKPWENSRLLNTLRTQIEIGRARRLRQRLRAKKQIVNRKLRQELNEAFGIQQALMPKTMPPFDGMEVAAAWQPARTVSGDYFDVIKFGERNAALCIGDVAGKGLPAALLMSNLQAALRSSASQESSPSELCARVNNIMYGNTLDDKFISFFYALIDLQRQTFVYANAGHNRPLLVRRSGECLSLGEGGGVLGVFPEQSYEQREIKLRAGDRLALFTDGLTEARNAGGEEFGEERLRKMLLTQENLSASELQTRIFTAVTEFCAGDFQDDVTLMVAAIE
jgi:sigma-B regulation protein RsbU (phosphoserine phosphatase)